MVNIECDPEFRDRRNPLVPVVDPEYYTHVLKLLGMDDEAIATRKIRVSSRIATRKFGSKEVPIWADYEPSGKTVVLYPGAHYPGYIRDLALYQVNSLDRDQLKRVCQEATADLHSNLSTSLLHEAKHDADNYSGKNMSDTPIRMGLTTAFSPPGVLAGIFIASQIAADVQSEIHLAAGLALGVFAGIAAALDEVLVYWADPIERRARKFEKVVIPPSWGKLVDTLPNPSCDLEYIHAILQNDGSTLGISNRQVLDLRALG